MMLDPSAPPTNQQRHVLWTQVLQRRCSSAAAICFAHRLCPAQGLLAALVCAHERAQGSQKQEPALQCTHAMPSAVSTGLSQAQQSA